MFPLFQAPHEFLKVAHGKVNTIQFFDNVLTIELTIFQSTVPIRGHQFSVNLANPYDYRAFLASVGQDCWSNGSLNCYKLIGQEVLVVFREGQGQHSTYNNFHSIILLSKLKDVSA